MKLTQNNQNRFSRILAGWCGLLFYVGACSPLGLGLATVVGSLDRDHQMRFQPGPSGMQLVLHHGANCVGHHHGLAARALSVFSQPADSTDPDHILQFCSADNFKSGVETSLSKPNTVERFMAASFLHQPLRNGGIIEFGLSSRPPPGECVAQRCLRSTLLLI